MFDFNKLIEIAKGNYGTVYRGTNKLDGNKYALKIYLIRETNFDDKSMMKEFINLMKISSNEYYHENII